MQIHIIPPSQALAPALQHKIDRKTKPLGALGRLEALALQIGLVQQTLTPELRQPHLVVFAGDHGAARAGVSAYPQDVTWQMVENFLAGGAAINVFSRQMGLGLSVIDAGVNHDFGKRAGLIDAKIAPGTANYLDQPAMSTEQCDAALRRGREIAHALADNGCNCVGFGEMGIGNTAAASLLTTCLIGAEHGADLYTVTGRGTGLDDTGLAHKRELLKAALHRGGWPTDPLLALAEYGGFEIAMMAGAMLGAAERRMLLVIDGFIVTSALLAAHAINPNVLPYCVFAHRSLEPGHRVQLGYLMAEPLVELDLRLGEGTGAALAWPLIQAAANFLNDMASFESAGVSGQDEQG
ncbi:nicotinate-nucleotide--dimethylbenzimidazole phosphoribosyltransferase [Thauera linaloolentis]|uniref:Nicotinate-nucleotide--dimethylbenzimidazole phosphoribosyltransferase n=1 Tax=Thauera linaloolentis (strain DSM 12138 / JCM 21573 / CCUG 41526 / CIP 105981 / IAM 15112 / NBRC 102519 / 47Lol) TaxID=1123367 RepID=N6YQJ4_THAL4|nr:nicotinate-nucleotide--dimethylbenzimidazole phosphoribosyltransferase [Thauera linaloolentis]ENO84493.1 nicotinate-nucleotide--dimethylbenzimidazole phosphoribosyltransferase [Thauera linaloolentis 47Lol = DSM 12138]MCM8564522.1 nicotinate-nucleotide--dimethylbenzimidazole phosphoribosyltransferase [Thauera linaloolentis]